MIIFGFLISDMVFLVKNIFVLIFNVIQLSVIFYNRNRGFDSPDGGIPEHRAFRGEEHVWGKIGDMINNNQVADADINGITTSAPTTTITTKIDPISMKENPAFTIEELY